jgi:hypothetical protein
MKNHATVNSYNKAVVVGLLFGLAIGFIIGFPFGVYVTNNANHAFYTPPFSHPTLSEAQLDENLETVKKLVLQAYIDLYTCRTNLEILKIKVDSLTEACVK